MWRSFDDLFAFLRSRFGSDGRLDDAVGEHVSELGRVSPEHVVRKTRVAGPSTRARRYIVASASPLPEGLPSRIWFGLVGEDGGELDGEEEEDHDKISGLVPDVDACSVRSVILARESTCAPCTMSKVTSEIKSR